MTRRRVRIGLLLVLVAVLTALLTNTGFVQDTVAPWAYYVLRVLSNLINSIPQLLLWLLFVLFGFQMLMAGLVRFIGRFLDARVKAVPEPGEETIGSVEKYARWLSQLNHGHYFQARLARSLADLTLQTLGNHERLSYRELESILNRDDQSLPPDVVAYLRTGVAREEIMPNGRDRIVQNLVGTNSADAHLRQLHAVLDYLEEQLETPY
jgi:hypothetical protein